MKSFFCGFEENCQMLPPAGGTGWSPASIHAGVHTSRLLQGCIQSLITAKGQLYFASIVDVGVDFQVMRRMCKEKQLKMFEILVNVSLITLLMRNLFL